jgi:glycosyltransferase involved in cell wall biosynthesis
VTRIVVFEDSVYRRDRDGVYTDRAFLLFAASLSGLMSEVTMLGRLDPEPGRSYYRLPGAVRFRGLPHYPSLASPRALVAILRSARTAWSALGAADVAWLMGPQPLALLMVLMARVRGTPTVLGVRQDLPRYARDRHPGRRWTHVAADALELAWRRLARTRAVVAVGPDLARQYAGSQALLELVISLVGDVQDGPRAAREPERPLRLLSVGRIDAEKNPLLLADVLALLREHDPRWELDICGEGALEGALRTRLAELGVAEAARFLGYVPVDAGLMDVYRASDVFLHVSWTEGLPQVLYEAWGAGVPVVATAVGGVAEVADGAALLIEPGDARAAADAVLRVAGNQELAARLVGAGTERASSMTMDATLARAAEFLRSRAA